jgi:hypothetical protein
VIPLTLNAAQSCHRAARSGGAERREQAAQYLSHKTVVIVQDFACYNEIEVYFSRSESQLKGLYRAIEEIAKG